MKVKINETTRDLLSTFSLLFVAGWTAQCVWLGQNVSGGLGWVAWWVGVMSVAAGNVWMWTRSDK